MLTEQTVQAIHSLRTANGPDAAHVRALRDPILAALEARSDADAEELLHALILDYAPRVADVIQANHQPLETLNRLLAAAEAGYMERDKELGGLVYHDEDPATGHRVKPRLASLGERLTQVILALLQDRHGRIDPTVPQALLLDRARRAAGKSTPPARLRDSNDGYA